ncbi:hypothetical protein PLICRDRAFT_52645 [Plicaturopsis crispa FD-325 SS-3]|nr:hypothetical protein PLICRDRAFT_52645 [Plicaturopsis crispa FD-325 SS-3]
MSQIPGLATTNNDHRPSDDPQPVQKASTSDLSRGASGSAPDPASSLRAAALLTLKSKRRKPATDLPPAVPPRPIDTSFQLDYGQDDTLETSPQAVFTAPKVAPEASTSSTKPSPSDNEDAHVREEGEISDTEESKTPAPPRKNPASPKNVPAKVAGPTSASPSIKKKQPAAQPLLDRISSPVALPLAPSVVPSPVQHRAPTIRTVDSNMEGLHVLDSEHVRPGLAMNQDQYNAAKDIILDLLGWGVPPEYLVDCGLSRQIVFYVFHELNLRLPANLDTTGLVLYTPEVVASAHIARRTQSPTQPPLRHDLADSPSSSRILRHPSLPSRPVDTPVSPTSSLPTPGMSHPSPVSPPTLDRNPSLHDMEQQRRRELLARKAVQASRKQRAGTASDGNAVAGPSSITPASSFSDAQHDIAMASLVPNETVDDFLNSIGPVGETHNGKGKSVDVHRPSPVAQRLKDRIFGPSDQMDVDDAIPGFVTHMRPPSDKPLSSSPPPVPEYSLQDLRTPTSADSLQSNAAEPPPLTASSVETGHSSQNGTGEKPSLLGNGAGSSEVPRRGTKRPVAADFVDLEPRPPSHNGYANGHNNPLTRRKTGSFASVSGMRRCVIDLSDSEDEGGEVDDQGHNSRHPVLQPSRMGSDTPQYRISTPPYQTVAPSTMSTMSPAALHEKELEIRHMRELIAKKREETRLKKLASMSGRSTPNGVLSDYPSSTIAQSGLATSSTLPDAPVSVKQEEVDPPSSWINPSLGHEASNRTYHDAAEGSPMQEDDKVTRS